MLNTDRLCPGCMNDNGGERVCPICGYDSAEQNPDRLLPTGFWLNERYLVGRALGSDGEGADYIGWDNVTDEAVNIREYYPEGVAERNPDRTVLIDADHRFAFNEGLMEFLELNRTLMQCELPSLIPVLSVFEDNGTGYAVSSPFSGITLQSFLERNGDSLKWEQARPLFLPLIDTLAGLHEKGIIHGGVSPETVLVGRDGKLRLGHIAIRRIRTAAGELTPVLYPGFAAAEQYGGEGMELGEYTDVYGISATLFRVLIGTVPPAANERLQKDTLAIPAHFAEELPRPVLVALANGMQTLPAARTANIDGFRNEMVYGETDRPTRRNTETHAVRTELPAPEKKGKKKQKKDHSGAKYAALSAVITAVVFLLVAGGLAATVFRDVLFGTESEPLNNSSDYVAPPSVPQIGDYDSDAAETVKLYPVPELRGKYYSQIFDNIDSEEYERLEFVIKGKEFSTQYAKGTVCAQSIAPGTSVERDTVIELTISLGPQEIRVANVVGLDEISAKLELLKQGFLYENIEVVEMYDSESKPAVVLEQSPSYGTTTNTEVIVRIYVNSYKGDEESSSNGSSSGSDGD